MAGLNGNYLKTERRRRSLNTSSILYDIINGILGVGVIICTFFILINVSKYEKLFPIAFLLAGTMNFIMGIKYVKRHEVIRTIALFLATVVLYVVGGVTLVGLWFS